MVTFLIAAALAGAAAGVLILSRAKRAAERAAGDEDSLGPYRRALAEVDDLAARGLVTPDDHRAARAEAGRRLLAAVGVSDAPPSRTLAPPALIAVASAAPLAALLLYLAVGSPGWPDQPFAPRLAAWRAHPESAPPAGLAAALRSIAAARPTDPEPWRRLSELDLSIGDLDGATHALRKATALAQGRPDLMASLGEVLVLKARGKVDAEARAVFLNVLRADPRSPPARYYLARADIDEGRTAMGLEQWRDLLADLSPADPRRPLLAGQIAQVEATGAATDAEQGSTSVGPEVDAAIKGMVAGLATRLTRQPDDPQGWVRLVRAYAVLGESDRRDAALATARRRFAGDESILRELEAARVAPK